MYEDEGEADGQTCEVTCTFLAVGSAEHYKHEDEGKYELGNECLESSAFFVSVCAEATSVANTVASSDEVKDSSADDSSDDLEQDVHTSVFAGHTFAEPNTESNGWVDVAA